MQIGLLFYSDTLAMTAADGTLKGRAVANHGLLRALAEQTDEAHQLTVLVSSLPEVEPATALMGGPRTHVAVHPLLSWPEQASAPLDVVHVLGPDLYRGLYLRNARVHGTPVVTGLTHSLGHAQFYEWLVLTALQRPETSDALVCTTPTAARAVQAMQQAVAPVLPSAATFRTPVIPLGVPDTWQITPDAAYRATLQIAAGRPMFLLCGRWSYTAKADLVPLLMAWREVARGTSGGPVLVLAGATEDRSVEPLLQQVASELGVTDQVRLVPNPDDATKRQLFAAADALIALADNYQETFGIAVVEGLAAGLPVIASAWDGYQSLVVDGETGWLIPTRAYCPPQVVQRAPLLADALTHGVYAQATATDLPALVAAIRACSEQPERRRLMGEAARRAAQAYRWSTIVPQYFALWAELCAARERGNETPAAAGAAFLPALRHADIFPHYASHCLDRTDLLRLSAAGAEAVQGALPLRMYGLFAEVLQSTVVSHLLALLQCGPRTVAAIEREFNSLSGDKFCDIQLHLHWLLKYGLVTIEP